MKIENKFKYKLTDRLGTIDVFPLGESDFSIEWSRSDSEDQFDYEKQLSGKMTFVGDAFSRFMLFEKSMYRCDEQKLELFHECNGIETLFFSGKIALNDAEFNLDKCQIVLKFTKDSKNDCYDFNKSEKANVFQLVQDRVKVKLTVIGGGVLEVKDCRHINTHWTTGDPTFYEYWCSTGNPENGNWTAQKRYEQMSGMTTDDAVDNIYQSVTVWVREIVELDCDVIPPTSWILIENNCPNGKNKFAKKPTLFNCTNDIRFTDENNYVYSSECRVMGDASDGVNEIDNGFLMNSVLVEFLKRTCPNLTLKSDFFQINPDVVSAVNYVTNKKSTTNEIVMFQKSDVKRPNATGNAWKLELTIEKILEALFKVFNVRWRIEGNVFRLEHISWFSRNQGIDIVGNPNLNKFFLNQYSYQNEKIPKKEIFKFKEQRSSNWVGEIEYLECVGKGKKNEETILVDDMTTDVQFVLDNPESDSKNVEDSGFVLMSTTKVGSEYFINQESTTMGSSLNNVFSWEILIRDFLGYDRPLKKAKVNGVETTFFSSKPTKKGQTFAIPYSLCSTEFNPDDIVSTKLGDGIVDSATFRFKDCFLELGLLYSANENLIQNVPPTISGGGVFSTFKNVPLTIPLTVSDADGVVERIELATPFSGGLVTFEGNNVVFVPETDFVGIRAFSVVAFDNYNERSNVLNFIINVNESNVAPIAQDETLNVYQGETFNQPLSIFSNDSDDFGFTLVNGNLTTAQGVNITINSNGFFTYVPPTNFEGVDSFVCEITDGEFTSSATVYLNVIFKNKPIAVVDVYQTTRNVSLSIDGTSLGQAKLTANDYTPDGNSYSYTTTAETKATNAGGEVVIATDGKFTYNPPLGFTGQDSFTYTVSNPNGSGTGTVYISVIPPLFIELSQVSKGHDNLYRNCDGVNQLSGIVFKKDFVLKFYLDAGKTQPVDVTNFKFRIFIEEKTEINGSETNVVFQTGILNGSQFLLAQNYEVNRSETDCDGINESILKNLSIVSHSNYTII